MLALVILLLGALSVAGGFVLVIRGIGGQGAEGTFTFLGMKLQVSKVGPGVIFALFGIALIVLSAWTALSIATNGSNPASSQSRANQEVPPKPTSALASGHDQLSNPGLAQPPAEANADGPPSHPAAPQAAPSQAPAAVAAENNNGIVNTGTVVSQNVCIQNINFSPDAAPSLAHNAGLATQECFTSKDEAKAKAIANLNEAATSLHQLQSAKSGFFFRALDAYKKEPSAANWQVVKDDADSTRHIVKVAIEALMTLDPSYQAKVGNTLKAIVNNLHTRDATLDEIQLTPDPPSADELANIEREQHKLFDEMAREIEQLTGKA